MQVGKDTRWFALTGFKSPRLDFHLEDMRQFDCEYSGGEAEHKKRVAIKDEVLWLGLYDEEAPGGDDEYF